MKTALFQPLLEIYGCLLELWKGKPAIRRVNAIRGCDSPLRIHGRTDGSNQSRQTIGRSFGKRSRSRAETEWDGQQENEQCSKKSYRRACHGVSGRADRDSTVRHD